jgi:hypothetical protein
VEPILISIVSALVAGATAKAKDVASKAVSDAYDGLKSLLIRKLGKSGAVQSVEDDPESNAATANLASALSSKNLHQDGELKQQADQVEEAVAAAQKAGVPGAGDINIDSIRGRVITVQDLVASGSIHLGPVTADTGDVNISRLRAGAGDAPKNG